MPNLLSRFRRRKASLPVTEIADQQPTTPALSSQHEAVLDQKIHPNLAELVEDFPPIFFVPSAPEPSRASTSTARDDGIIPLKPAGRTRRRSSDTPAKQTSIALAKAAGQLEKLPESPTSAHPALLEAADVSHHTQQSPNQGDRTRNDSARDTDDTITTAVPAVIRHHSDTSTVPSTTAVRPLNDLHLSRTRLHPVYIPDASDIAHDIIYSNDGHDPTRSPNSLSASSFQETTDPPYENSSSPTGSGTFGVFTRLTNLVHGSPAISLTQSPNPPSSWSTFGRRDIRSGRSNSQTTDVGSSSRPSSSGTSHSHTPSSTTRSHIGAPDNTSGSAFGSASSPSSGFTFGSHGPGPRALTSPSPPPLPPLDHPAFGTLAEKDNSNAAFRNDGSKDEKTALFSDHGPRPSSSMPAMRSNSQPSSIWLAESSSRPRLQDIFSSPVSSPTTSRRTSRRSTVSRGSNRQRRHRSKSASTSRKRGESGGDRPDIVGQGSTRDALPPSENGNQARENSSSQVFNLGSPFLLQGISSARSYPHNLSDTRTSSIPSNENPAENLMSIDAVPGISSTGSSKTRSRSRSRKGGSTKPQVSSTARASTVPSTPSIPSPISASDQPSNLMVPPLLSVTGPTPAPSPIAELKTPPASPEKGKGKRKADEVEGGGTPPEAKKINKTTFAAENPRPHRASGNSTASHAPSSYQSYHRNKRVRLSGVMSAVGEDRYTYQTYNPNPSGSFASRGSSSAKQGYPRTQSRPSSCRPKSSSIAGSQKSPSRRSISQASIPISALISPHAPSISQRSMIYRMRDPRKPPRVQSTPWTLAFPVPGEGEVGYFQRWKWWQKENRAHSVGWADGGGSPLHAWLFFLGFVLFPIWWVAGLLVRIPKTRRIGDADALEKGVVLDDPQVEHDAKSWRQRCRVMAAVSLVTYVPFIVLVVVFAR